ELRGLIGGALLKAHRVVAVSAALREGVLALGVPAQRIIVQRNGVEGDRFMIRDRMISRQYLGANSSAPLACFVGNLVHEKGPDILLESIASLPDLHAVFLGEGNLRESLKARAERL